MANPAEGYESYMVPTLFAPCPRILIWATDPKPGERVLDVGCGTGIIAREVASHLGATAAVAAVDLEWMDSWQVYSKTRAAHAAGETSVPHPRRRTSG